jgi:hypothetical protein
MYVERNTEARSPNYCVSRTAISIIHCECLCSLSYPHAICMRHIVIGGLSWSTIIWFSTLSHKWHDFFFLKKRSLNIKYVFWFSLQRLSDTIFIMRGWDSIPGPYYYEAREMSNRVEKQSSYRSRGPGFFPPQHLTAKMGRGMNTCFDARKKAAPYSAPLWHHHYHASRSRPLAHF